MKKWKCKKQENSNHSSNTLSIQGERAMVKKFWSFGLFLTRIKDDDDDLPKKLYYWVLCKSQLWIVTLTHCPIFTYFGQKHVVCKYIWHNRPFTKRAESHFHIAESGLISPHFFTITVKQLPSQPRLTFKPWPA